MANLTEERVLDALRTVEDPDLHRDLVTLGMIKDLRLDDGGAVSLRVVLTTPACPMKGKIQADVEAALRKIGVERMNVVMDAEVRRVPMGGEEAGPTAARMPGVK
ncbi:MAG: DUF59 domain-containing protein [Myxococcales bacterium]|nr:DUF59 domain-containing protein [Myxococcales bacterium]